MDSSVTHQLSANMAMQMDKMNRVSLTREEFNDAYQQDKVTQDLLPKGIDGFIRAREDLIKALAEIR